MCVPSVTISTKPQIVVPNSSINTMKSVVEYDVAGNRERMLAKKYQNSCGGFVGRLQMAGRKEYWNQTTSSELEKDVSRE